MSRTLTQLIRRTSPAKLKNLRIRGGHSNESFFSEGKHEPGGLLFNESPPKAGESRAWESWEAPWYFTFGAATAILTIGLSAKPDTSLLTWAAKEARARKALEESGS